MSSTLHKVFIKNLIDFIELEAIIISFMVIIPNYQELESLIYSGH